MKFGTLTVVLLLLLTIWLLVRKRRDLSREPTHPATRPLMKTSAYHAVSIRFPKEACLAARAMAGRRFLASAAPGLPLPDCDAMKCTCRWAHHDDRRSGKDRRSPFSPARTMAGTGKYEVEKRTGTDRRKTPTE